MFAPLFGQLRASKVSASIRKAKAGKEMAISEIFGSCQQRNELAAST